MPSHYTALTPSVDLGKRQPKKAKVRKLLAICKDRDWPVRNRLNPGFATTYQAEFIRAFREICRIYADSDFRYPDIQVLVLLLDNEIYPCRAEKFNRQIVVRLAGNIFSR